MLTACEFTLINDQKLGNAVDAALAIKSGALVRQMDYGLLVRPEHMANIYLIIPFVQRQSSASTTYYHARTESYVAMLQVFIFQGWKRVEVFPSEIPGFVEFVADVIIARERKVQRLFIAGIFTS